MQDRFDRLLTLVPWTLQRLLRQEYEVTCDATGLPQVLNIGPDYGVWSTEAMEDAPKTSPLWDSLERLFALREHLTPEIVSAALTEIPLPPAWLPRDELLHADWPGIGKMLLNDDHLMTFDEARALTRGDTIENVIKRIYARMHTPGRTPRPGEILDAS